MPPKVKPNKPLCKGQHDLSQMMFCQNCAKKKKDHYYCTGCEGVAKHAWDTDKYSLSSNIFKDKIHKFAGELRGAIIPMSENMVSIEGIRRSDLLEKILKESSPLHALVLNSENGEIPRDAFQSEEFRKFLDDYCFWELKSDDSKKKMKQFMDKNPTISNFIQNPRDYRADEFKFEWGVVQGDFIDPSQEQKAAYIQLVELEKESELLHLYLDMYSSFNISDCRNLLKKCQVLIEQNPFKISVYFAKIRLLQLLPEGNRLIPEILQKMTEIKSTFIEHSLYYYYMAVAQWKMLKSNAQITDDLTIFFEPRNQKYYAIENKEQYMKNITKAIEIDPNYAFYSARGVCHICEGNYDQAYEDFRLAKEELSFYCDSLDSNQFFAKLKLDRLDASELMAQIDKRTTQFIINAAKYLKKMKNYDKLAECCDLLIQRESNQQTFKIQQIQALINQGNQKEEGIDESEQRTLYAKLESLKVKPSKEVLENKLAKLIAKNLIQRKEYDQAISHYHQIAMKDKGSSSTWYNYAVALFETNNIDEAEEAIDKAIHFKSKPKFLKLKLYIACLLNKWDEAEKLVQNFSELNQLKEFIEDQAKV